MCLNSKFILIAMLVKLRCSKEFIQILSVLWAAVIELHDAPYTKDMLSLGDDSEEIILY